MLLRVVQVGMGDWGRTWLPVLQSLASVAQLVACCDGNPDALAGIELPAGVGRFQDLRHALASTPCEAVLVTASTTSHRELAMAALSAGKHVLIEKPMVLTLPDAEELVGAADSRGVSLVVSQNYRYMRPTRVAERCLRQKRLGEPRRASVVFRKGDTGRRPEGKEKVEFAVLPSIAVHHFDLMRYLFRSEGSLVYCSTRLAAGATEPERPELARGAHAVVDLANGMSICYSADGQSSGCPTAWTGEWRIECEGGELFWCGAGPSYRHGRVAVRRPDGAVRPVRWDTSRRDDDRAQIVRDFVASIEMGTAAPTSGRDNLSTIGLMSAAIESAVSGQSVVPRYGSSPAHVSAEPMSLSPVSDGRTRFPPTTS